MNPRARRIRRNIRKNKYPCEVPGVSKDLFRAVRSHNIQYNDGLINNQIDLTNRWVKELIDNFDFKIVITNACGGTRILVNKPLGLVIKVMYTVGFTMPTERAPTVIVDTIKRSYYSCYHLVIQKLVDISREAVIAADKKISEDGRDIFKYGSDIHDKNYGLYNNKAVVFDW